MSIEEVRNANETNSSIREYTVEIPVKEMRNGRNYFRLPNGKRYYIDSDSDEVYLAEDQSQD